MSTRQPRVGIFSIKLLLVGSLVGSLLFRGTPADLQGQRPDGGDRDWRSATVEVGLPGIESTGWRSLLDGSRWKDSGPGTEVWHFFHGLGSLPDPAPAGSSTASLAGVWSSLTTLHVRLQI